ncbi:stromelysin-1-like [Bufo gargarizans]|uniref:stromelysin-1-like n=1 Tax=Bufo gargarizans TaxID=30331 RepID=UPI001CF2A426|nr:stromelysin-1-like [Bufo gargarizans]
MVLLWFFSFLVVKVYIVELVPVTGVVYDPADSKDLTKEDLIKAREYIDRFYNASTKSRKGTNLTEDKIKAMQTFFGLHVTGKINQETLKVMKKPRCGVPDVQRFSHFPGKPKWEKTSLTYRIVNYSPDIPNSEVDNAIAQALRLWSEVTPLKFRQIYSGEGDIMISFGFRDHGDFFPFDGPLGILAHAFAPGNGIGGDAHFDEEETWTLGPQGISIFLVALHELGHALGLEHSRYEQAIMYPTISQNSFVDPTKFKLFKDDIEGIQALYGPRIPNVQKPTVKPQPKPPKEPQPKPPKEPQPKPPKEPQPKPPKEPQPKPPKEPQPKPPKEPQPKPPKEPQPKPPKEPQPKPPKEPQPKPPKEPQPKPPKEPQPKPPKEPQPKPPKEPQPKPPKEPQPKPPKEPQPKPPKEPQPKPPKEPQPKPPKEPQPKPPKEPQPKPPKEPQPKPPKEPQPKPPKEPQPKPPKEPQPKPPKQPQPKPPNKPVPKPTKQPLPQPPKKPKPTKKPESKPTRKPEGKPTKASKPADVPRNPTAPRKCDRELKFDAITSMRGDLLFFKEGIIWRKSATKSNIDTLLLNATWPRLQSVDAAYEVPQRDIVYLFKGRHFWITRGFSMVLDYPQDITQFGFPSSVKKIDAALFLKEERKAIFFVRDKYWSYDYFSLKMDSKSPRKIKNGFPGIGKRVDVAFQDNDHLYFSSGANQIEYSPRRKHVIRKIPNYQWLNCK